MNYVLTPKTARVVQDMFMLHCAAPKMYQFITYAFLHAGWAHLLGNMLFLYIFGNSINDKLGHLEYLLFYLSAAVVSGAGYALTSSANLLGASGAIAAVTTAFLVLFPRSHVLVVYWFYIIGTFELPSLFLIAFKMILLDNVIVPALSSASSPIAHGAHLVGYLFGFMVPLGLLFARALERDQFDILALWSRAIRRKKYTNMTKSTLKYGRPINADVKNPEEVKPRLESAVRLSRQISEDISRYDLASAAEKYLEMIKIAPDEVLTRKHQLDIANQLTAENKHAEAAEAYEKYLDRYPSADQIEQVKLLLGVLYSRYLSNPEKAKELLTQAREKLRDTNQRTLCEQELSKLNE